ncbi:Cytochrome oxidase biogenesis protein, putative copper metallochaperone [Streptomyces venezuelae]|uniref:SCO family protein n=1 Tax=Streptomyces gardneri TaxID=66892 RepID=UPI0006BE1115|nr:SCO family protein [Streptomyces gardneri]ALO09752.1 Cytochrome oxidase biogenesis protein, putative copper metallochaperone [Streptomyces venezuelae]QPK46816.1 SCO family protein [Streptomyces gardneri]WRK38218.1 SCO family protein [Streptomyces venezuelae]CUM39815.1 Cytochrome oxidase biogenesis protein Sco1/SenC/PrrC, putative copper metallochaperone [Streptomyces venezuelae]
MSEEKTSGTGTARPGRRTPLIVAAVAIVAALGITAAVGLGGNDDKAPGAGSNAVAEVSGVQDSTKAATVLDRPFTKPDLVLTDTKGQKYDLRERTKGKPTLVFFGYTHCPDVCPMTMSNIAIAMKQLPKADQDKLQVVFVTTDPERDTSAELAKWLPAAGDPSFTGLTGDFPTIQAGARSMGIGIDPPKKEGDKVVSMHGAQVIAFSPTTDQGYVLYGEDTTPEDYAKDLPKLIKGENP